MRVQAASRAWALTLGAAALAAWAAPKTAHSEEFDPAKIPWDQIESWAAGKSDQNPFKAGAALQPTPPPAQPQPQPPPVKPPPDQAKTEPPKAEPPKSDWTPKAGQRRPEPPAALQFRQKAQAEMEEDIKEANRRRDPKQLYDVYFRHDQFDLALQVLVQQIGSDQRRFSGEHAGPWLSEKYWETGIVARNRPAQPTLDIAFKDWNEKINHDEKNPGWMNWYNGMKEYFTNSAKVLQQVQDLDLKGDVESNALWQMCELFQQEHPPSGIRHVAGLYKLRDWYGDAYPQVQNGEVQWRLLDKIYNYLRMWELASEEAKTLIERYPQHWSVKNGEAHWRRAESLCNLGYSMPRGVKAYELWEEARKTYQFIQSRFPQLPQVCNVRKPPDPNANKSDCTLRIEDLNNRLRSQK